jgi:hypothetical protein
LFETVETELGVPRIAARKVLIPDLVGLHIHAQVPGLNDDHATWAVFFRENLVFQERGDEAPRVSPRGWELMTKNGRFDYALAGLPVRVRWQHVVEALDHLRRRPAINALTGVQVPLTRAAPTPQRKHGGRDYRQEDRPLVVEMRELIEAGTARSPFHAAQQVSQRAAGGGIPLSKEKRLVGRYSEVFRSEPNGVD